MKRFVIFLIVTALFASCEPSADRNKKVYKEANGRVNSLLIVMKNSEWKGKLGDEVRKIVAEPVLGLPQPESLFELSQVSIDNFGTLFKSWRSILSIGLGEENDFRVSTNVYAAPQKIVSIIGKTEEDIVQILQENSHKIVATFKNADINTVQQKILKKIHNQEDIKTFKEKGFTLKIPRTYNVVEDDGDFLWYRYHLSGGNSMELLAYTIPIENEDDINGNNIVMHRDAIGKKYIPGRLEGSHMITEEAYTPHIFKVKFKGQDAFETRGKWEVKGVVMAGPFLSYYVIDKPNNRIVVVEGLTYAPSANKRDHMFELEAIMKTLTIG